MRPPPRRCSPATPSWCWPGHWRPRARREIERLLAGTFAAVRFRDVQVEIVEVTVAGDVAYEVGKTVMTYEAGGQTYREMGKYLVAWKRLPGGEWKIHRDVSNSSGLLP